MNKKTKMGNGFALQPLLSYLVKYSLVAEEIRIWIFLIIDKPQCYILLELSD